MTQKRIGSLSGIAHFVNMPAFYQLKCYRSIIVHSKENVTEGTMAETDQMNINERGKDIQKMHILCWRAETKGERSYMLNEKQLVNGL